MSENSQRLQGVIFDVDGVLVMSLPFTTKAAIRMFAEKGETVHAEEFLPFLGQGEAKLIDGVAKSRGITIDLERDKARVYALYLEMIPGHLQPLPGAIAFVDHCHARGLKLAIASSGDALKVHASLKAIGLSESKFEVLVDGSQIDRKKPSPDLFLAAAKKLGLDPSRCLVVEDAEAGVAAAKAAGSRCLAVTSTTPIEKLKAADWITTDLTNVPEEVLAW